MISDGELRQMIHEGEELGYSTIVEALVEFEAYRKAFSEPVAWEYVEKQECNIGSPIHTYKLSEEKPEPHFNIFEVEALYRKPTIPE